MKKLLSYFGAFALTLVFGVGVANASFVDYGTDLNGKQCASPLPEDGTCNIVYNKDITLIGDSSSFDVNSKYALAQPNAPTMAEAVATQKEQRRQICMVIYCPAIN